MTSNSSAGRQIVILVLCLSAVLLLLFGRSFNPNFVLASNDGPLGAISQDTMVFPGAYSGIWYDLNSIGVSGGSYGPDLTSVLFWVLGPAGFSRYFVPIVLLFVGCSAWLFFRTLRLSALACVLGALAATLNSAVFSTACWGVGSQVICLGFNYLALAAIVSNPIRWPWLKYVLAGLAVGVGVMEGADVGAIYSLCIAAFVAFLSIAGQTPTLSRTERIVALACFDVALVFVQSLGLAAGIGTTRWYLMWVAGIALNWVLLSRKTWSNRTASGVVRVGLIGLCAAFMAAHTVWSLFETQIKALGNTVAQDTDTRAARWDFATQWSFPKRETLGLIVPGLFGYRLDTPMGLPEALQESYKGAGYWGAIGRAPAWDRYFADPQKHPIPDPNGGGIRHSGGGGYEGVPVVLVALWAVVELFRKKNSVFDAGRRRFLSFWFVVAIVSLVLSFGRFAPFAGLYEFLYFKIPGAAYVRNPAKLIAILNWSIVILFAHGVHGLGLRYLQVPALSFASLSARFKNWKSKAGVAEKRWLSACVVMVAAAFVGWLVYTLSRKPLEEYLKSVAFGQLDPAAIAEFSIRQVGWFVLFLVLSAALLIAIQLGIFAGKRAGTAGVLLGVILVVDLGRANIPWVVHWNWVQKYASNPVIDFLRQKPYEQRVAIMFSHLPQFRTFRALYELEWKQHHFPYFHIQSLDIVQMPRMPQDLMAFEAVTQGAGGPTRRWELTNTRYLLGPAVWPAQNQWQPFVELLNQQFDPVLRRFRILLPFNLAPKPGIANTSKLEEITAEPGALTNSMYALYEFAGALPRAKLYSNWHVSTNDPAALQQWTKPLLEGLPADFASALGGLSPTDQATLQELTSQSFSPADTVLLADSPAVPAPTNPTNAPGTVEFTHYESRRMVLKAKAEVPSVLLLNDRYDPVWKVTVDGKPAELLRANFIMRGVYLMPGEHTVEFSFRWPARPTYLSLAAIILGILTLGLLTFGKRSPAGHSVHAKHPHKEPAKPGRGDA